MEGVHCAEGLWTIVSERLGARRLCSQLLTPPTPHAVPCRYVADGVVDFDALQRRAQPQPPGQRSAAAAAASTASGMGTDAQASSSSNGSSGTGSAQHAPQQHGQKQHPHPQQPKHGVVVKDGRIHLHLQQPAPPHLHLPTPLHNAAHRPHTASSTSNSSGGSSDRSSSHGSGAHASDGSASARHAPPAPADATSSLESGTRCRFIFLRGVQWSAPETNTVRGQGGGRNWGAGGTPGWEPPGSRFMGHDWAGARAPVCEDPFP